MRPGTQHTAVRRLKGGQLLEGEELVGQQLVGEQRRGEDLVGEQQGEEGEDLVGQRQLQGEEQRQTWTEAGAGCRGAL